MRKTQITLNLSNIKWVFGWDHFPLGDDELVQQAADHAHHLRQHLHRLHALRLHRRQRWASWKKRLKLEIFYFLFFFSSLAMASRPREHIICIYLPKGGFNCIFMCMDRYWYQILKLRYDQVSSHMGPPTYRGRKVIKTWLTWLINIQNTYILFPMIITIIMIMMMMNISSIIIMNLNIPTYRSCSLSTTLLCPAPSTPLWELLMRGPHAIFITCTSSLIQYVD